MKSSLSPLSIRSNLNVLVGVLLSSFASVSLGHAAETASANISSTSLGGGEFEYTITLTDTGTTDLDTFWNSWVPGKDFMPALPTNIVSPTDWTANITGGGSGDGYAIQWVTPPSTTTNPLTPNSSLVFKYESTDTPQVTAGNSPLFPGIPVETSFVYSGAPFSDAGFQFDVVSAPEPTSLDLTLLSGGLIALVALRQRNKLRGDGAAKRFRLHLKSLPLV